MQTIFRAGVILSSPPGRFARFIAVLLPFLPLFPCLLAGAASAWAADSRIDRGRGSVVAAATVLDATQTNIPGRVDVLGPAGTSSQADMPDASFAADPAIDANRATAEQLQTLRGIGPAMAARIIAERERQPFASLDDLARRVRGVGARRLRQWQEAGLLVSPRQPGGVQDRAVHGHRGHARSVGARAADTQGTEVRGTNAQSTHVMGAHALGAHVQGTQAPGAPVPGAPVPVGGATARPGRMSIPPPRHAGATDHPIEVIRGNPRLLSGATTVRPGSATKGRSGAGRSGAGRSAAGRSSAERSAAGREAAERSSVAQRPGDATQALSRSASATGARKASRASGPRADDPSCRTQRRIHQRSRSGKGAQVRRSKAPPLFEDRPLFDCRSIFDERSRLLPQG